MYCYAEEIPQRNDINSVIDFGVIANYGDNKKPNNARYLDVLSSNGTYTWWNGSISNRLILTLNLSTDLVDPNKLIVDITASDFYFAADIKYKFYFIESVVIN